MPPREDSIPPQHGLMPPHLQSHNSFSHIRNHQPSVSPPMPNGMFQNRHPTPQPSQMGSRPTSRNTIRRTSSNIVPMHHPHPTPPPAQNGYAYVPNPPIYNPQGTPNLPPQPSPQPQYQQFTQQQQPAPQQSQPQPQTLPPPAQQPVNPQNHAHLQQHQQQQQFLHDQRRLSQPPPSRSEGLQPPPQQNMRASPQPEPQPPQQHLRPPEHTPPQPKHMSSKSRSIFTPIDEGGSVLAQHFFGAPDPRPPFKKESVDIKPPPSGVTLPPGQTIPTINRPASQPSRSQSSAPEFAPPARSDTSGSKSGARPKLNLQIPLEASDGESAVGSSPQHSNEPSTNPTRGSGDHIVLPPPSPSASAVLSAGATGPPNPFARPPPPTSTQNRDVYQESRNNIETPISALPSRYMNNDLLPSPSNFFSEWGLNSAVLPSPLTFNTPADAQAQGFGRGDEGGEKRKGSLEDREGEPKKIKT